MIAVIGGGISGLAVGRSLQRAGAEFVVLEASSTTGGVVGTVRVGGQVLELGPQRTRLTAPVRALVAELGLEDRLVTAPDLPLYIYCDGRLREVPLDLRGALTTDLIGWRDRARALLEPFTAPLADHETAADFFTRKFGRRTYDRVIAPLFGGLYASDPADMPARHTLAPALRSMGVRGSLLAAAVRGARGSGRAPACTFDGGLQVLTDALARQLGDRVRTSTPVHAIDRRGGQLHLVTEDDELVADRVVLACPADTAARLVAGWDADTARRLAALHYHPLAVVHLLADAQLHGHGYQVALDERIATHGVAWNHAMFGRTGLYTAFLGGAGRPDVAALSDDALGDTAALEFMDVTGFPARPIHVHRTRMPAWDTSWNGLQALALDPRVQLCANWWGRPGITGRLLAADRLATALAAEQPGARKMVPAA
jgi:protoporphyrinogen/coproporphyrinogen III oxidase